MLYFSWWEWGEGGCAVALCVGCRFFSSLLLSLDAVIRCATETAYFCLLCSSRFFFPPPPCPVEDAMADFDLCEFVVDIVFFF